MAKDPAFLFYSNDFLSGTFLLSDEQVGKYIRLLCIQHQKGILTKKDMLNICKTYDEDIFNKFTIDNDGNYFNIRLKEEYDKRKAYSESRRKNRLNTKKEKSVKTYVKHMEDENVNKDKDINKNEDKKVKNYRKFAHLKLTIKEFENLKEKYTKQQIDDILDSIENYKKNTNYRSLYLTALKWLKKDVQKSSTKITDKEAMENFED